MADIELPETWNRDEPLYHHPCKECIYLGRFIEEEKTYSYDLYVHPAKVPVTLSYNNTLQLIARYGDFDPDCDYELVGDIDTENVEHRFTSEYGGLDFPLIEAYIRYRIFKALDYERRNENVNNRRENFRS